MKKIVLTLVLLFLLRGASIASAPFTLTVIDFKIGKSGFFSSNYSIVAKYKIENNSKQSAYYLKEQNPTAHFYLQDTNLGLELVPIQCPEIVGEEPFWSIVSEIRLGESKFFTYTGKLAGEYLQKYKLKDISGMEIKVAYYVEPLRDVKCVEKTSNSELIVKCACFPKLGKYSVLSGRNK